MKTVTAGMLTLLATRQFFVAYLYTFTLVDGSVKRYTSGASDIVYSANTYSSGGVSGVGPGPWFNTEQDDVAISWKLGVEVDTLTMNVLPGTATYNGLPLLQALRYGVFDGATLNVDLAVMPTYGDVSNGVIPSVFFGRVGEVDCGRTGASMTINSHLEILNQTFPRNLFQPGCINTLFDASCTLVRASFAVASTATSGSTTSTINNTALGQATGYFSLGQITFTSGANSGFTRSVKVYTQAGTNTLTLTSPLPFAPAAGDTFTVYPGCDKLQATCSGKFSNLANFRGMPYVPQPETAV